MADRANHRSTKFSHDDKHQNGGLTGQGNEGDPYIAQIIRVVGKVDFPAYLYGLQDREEYQLSLATITLRKFQKSGWKRGFKATGNSSLNKIGICLDLRKNQFNRVVRLIKHLTRR